MADQRFDVFDKAISQSVGRSTIPIVHGIFLGRDEITDYHVIAERSYEWGNIYGTRVTRYDGETHD